MPGHFDLKKRFCRLSQSSSN